MPTEKKNCQNKISLMQIFSTKAGIYTTQKQTKNKNVSQWDRSGDKKSFELMSNGKKKKSLKTEWKRVISNTFLTKYKPKSDKNTFCI